MNRPHVTAREAEELFERWYDSVAHRVREAAAKARGRRDRHRSDLEDLHRDLGSVELRWLLEPEPEARPGTAGQAVAEADRFLAEAEQHHAWGAHKAAIVWLQQAYIAANQALEWAETTASPEVRYELADGPLLPGPGPRLRADSDTDRPDDPDGPGPRLQIPHQRS
ncbi:hypothetical protein [Actinospica robiniae]|uniref:hypothetical protein n=1 Tax=Actinospica robiniae TaxID=304901 RepID=UPI00040DEB62|nr:hypothetical protein [Actinospica robiniae]